MKRYCIFGVAIILFIASCVALWSCKSMSIAYPFRKKYTIKSDYSKNQRIYLQVYCEDEFNFKKSGNITGSFTLSFFTDFNALSIQILIPKFFWGSETYDSKWSANIKLPVKVIFEWNDNNNIKQIANTTVELTETCDGTIGLQYVPLPIDKKIDYTLIFGAGSFCKGYLCKRLEYNDGIKEIDKTADINEYPDKYSDEFWKAKFMIVTGRTKGFTGLKKQKPARD